MNIPSTAVYLAAALVTAAQAEPIVKEACLNGQSAARITLDLSPGRYIESRIRFNHIDLSRNGASLYLNTDGHRRTIFRNQTGRQDFLLWLPEAHRAELILEAADNTRLCYQLSLHYRTTEGYVTDSSREPLQSPRLQTLQRLMRNTAYTKQTQAAFWQRIAREGGTPMIEPLDSTHSLLTFLWHGAKHNVRLIGGPSNDHEWLQQLPGSDIWFRSFKVKNDVRLSYQFAPDIPKLAPESGEGENAATQSYRQRRALLSTLQADPLNPHRFDDASLIDLNPANPILSDDLPALSGRLKQYAFTSTKMNNQRRIWIYQTDPAIAPARLYLLDGHEYLNKAKLPAMLDQLRRQGRIPPLLAVFIDNADSDSRRRELPPNPEFADMLVQELIPFIEQQTGFHHHSNRSILAGSSYGGLAAAYIASRHPQSFSKVLAMSGSFWWHPEGQSGNGIAALYTGLPKLPLSWYIAAGRYETARAHDEADILHSSRNLANTLAQKGYSVVFREYPGGHDYAMWQSVLADGLPALLQE